MNFTRERRMNITFSCGRCGEVFSGRRELVGRRIKCRVCGLVQKVPQPAPPVPGAGVYPLAADHASMRSSPQEPRSKPARRRLSSRWIEGFHDFAGARSHLQELSILLILLSSADIFMTYVLLRTSPRFHESNPVAQWIFQRWNIAGMVVFKFASIGTAIAIGEFVERRRPGWGKFVLLVGCAAAAAAFWHGLRLYLGFDPMSWIEDG